MPEGTCRCSRGLPDFQSQARAVIIHFLVALLIGSIFGILFSARRARLWLQQWAGAWDLGIFLWFFGPLTVFPIVGRQPLDWSRRTGPRYSVRWSATLLRIHPGYHLCIPGPHMGKTFHSIRSIESRTRGSRPPFFCVPSNGEGWLGWSEDWSRFRSWLQPDILPKIAGLDTSFGGVRGLVIHLLVSVGIGMTYGLLFPQ